MTLLTTQPVQSEISDVQESKRFGYIPSRGRKSEEQMRSGASNAAVTAGSAMMFDDESKRAFHGARGKKMAMVPMYPYPYTADLQWKRSKVYPGMNVYAANGVMDQMPQAADLMIPMQFQFGRGRKEMLGEDNESAEFYPEAGSSQHFNQPFYSRLM